MKEDFVSIVMPAFNAEEYIEEAVQSIIKQTHSNWELILIDDASTDKTIEKVKKLKEKEEKIHFLQLKERVGPAEARNKGIKEAKGDYLAFLDADDRWKEEKLKRQLEEMKKRKSKFSYTSFSYIDKEGKKKKDVIVPKTLNYKQALKNTIIQTSTVMLDLKQIPKEQIWMPDVRK